jgi:nucleotide-binding universal stress UspA family protein
MFERLLVPLDGSEAARVALTYAASIPSKAVRILTALPGDDAGRGLADSDVEVRWQSKDRADVDAYLTKAASELEQQGREVEVVVVAGKPVDWILEYARDADLIVMTTHGYGARRRAVYGSVADQIARRSSTPVMLIRGGERPITARPVQRIIVPLDGSDRSEAALPMAADLADTLGVPVVLARVVDASEALRSAEVGRSPSAAYAASVDSVRNAASGYLDEHAQELRNRSIAASIKARDGEPVTQLLNLAQPGDLFVMTSHGRGGVSRMMLGSVSEKLVRQAQCPVLLIRSQPGEDGNAGKREDG